MNASLSSSPFSLPDTAPELAQRFCVILAGLAGLVARRFVRMPHLMGFTLLLWGRLNRAVRRFARGMTRPAKARAARKAASRQRVAPSDAVRLPSGRGWLVRELGYEAAGYASQLQHLVAEPEMQALLGQMPGLGRMLRPMCRMLGVPIEGALVPAVVAERVERKPEKPPVAVWPRKALPRLPKGAWFEVPGPDWGKGG